MIRQRYLFIESRMLVVENSGGSGRRSNRSGQPQRNSRTTRTNQSSRSTGSSRAVFSNRTAKPTSASDSRSVGRAGRSEKSSNARGKRFDPASDKKRSFESKPRSVDRNKPRDVAAAGKSTTSASRERDNSKPRSSNRGDKVRSNRAAGYQVRSTTGRDSRRADERTTEGKASAYRSNSGSNDARSSALAKSEFKPRRPRPERSDAEPRGSANRGTKPVRGGRDRTQRDARPQKFDVPRRFRGDLPRRERDQRARGSAPVIDQDVTGDELGEELIAELKTLPTGLTISVAQHLVMTQRYLELDPKLALTHAIHAKELAGRFPIVREIVGVAHYVNGNWQEALNDFRAVKRMATADHLVPMMADCERGLGRPERAISMLAENRNLPDVIGIEAAIVEAGARSDLGQHDAALVALKIPALTGYPADQTAYARLCFAYGATLAKLDRHDEALTWFARADKADPGATAAAEFLPTAAETIYLDDLDADS